MKYTLTITIQKPIKEVIKLYTNRGMLKQWQPELLNSKQIENYPHPKYTHQLALGKRKLVLTETIIRHELPEHFDVSFELKNVASKNYNSFTTITPHSTQWICHTEYKFKGIMNLVSFFMKAGLKKQSEMIMSNFKRFAESR